MSSSHNLLLNEKTIETICAEFEQVSKTPTIELLNNFLQKPEDYLASSILERRFLEDKIWIPEEERFEQKTTIPPLDPETAQFIKNLNDRFKAKSDALTPREISLLGLAYELGMGVEKNEGTGHHLYLQSAQSHCGYALISLYNAFYHGHTAFACNEELALDYLEKGISIGDSAAQVSKGKLLVRQAKNSEEEEKNALYESAHKYIAKAAEKLQPEALYLLGCAYCEGNRLVKGEKNLEKGIAYLSKAAQRGHIGTLTYLYKVSDEVDNKGLLLATADKFGDRWATWKLAELWQDHKGYNAWYIDLYIIPLLQKSDDIIFSLINLSKYSLTFRKNEEKAANYFYKVIRRDHRLTDIISKMDEIKTINAIFEKQLNKPITERNHKMIYEFAFSFRDAKNSHSKKLLTDFAMHQPDEFLAVSQKDSWEIVKGLVDEACGKSLEVRIKDNIKTIYKNIQQEAPELPTDLVELIYSYDARDVSYSSLFSKMNLGQPETKENKPQIENVVAQQQMPTLKNTPEVKIDKPSEVVRDEKLELELIELKKVLNAHCNKLSGLTGIGALRYRFSHISSAQKRDVLKLCLKYLDEKQPDLLAFQRELTNSKFSTSGKGMTAQLVKKVEEFIKKMNELSLKATKKIS